MQCTLPNKHVCARWQFGKSDEDLSCESVLWLRVVHGEHGHKDPVLSVPVMQAYR